MTNHVKVEIEKLLEKNDSKEKHLQEILFYIDDIFSSTSTDDINLKLCDIVEFVYQVDPDFLGPNVHSKINEKFISKTTIIELLPFSEYLSYSANLISNSKHLKSFEQDLSFVFLSHIVCLKSGKNEKDDYISRYFNKYLQTDLIDLTSFINGLKNEKEVLKIVDFVRKIPKICDYVDRVVEISINAKCYETEFFDKKPSYQNLDFHLFILKRFNSIYPMLTMDGEWGGGFYLRWKGKGIVIDPGFQFYTQLQKMGYSVKDIDCIFITHAHDDHCIDLPVIISALHKMNNKTTDFRTQKKITIFGSENAFRKYQFLNDGFRPVIFSLSRKDSVENVSIILEKLKITCGIQILPAYHDETPYSYVPGGSSLGICIELYDEDKNISRTIVFSGDTAIPENDPLILAKAYANCKPDILVLNLGKIEEDFKTYYGNHLGIKGCKDILSHMIKFHSLPKITLISEFGMEMNGFRIEIAEIIKNCVVIENPDIHEDEICIIPTDTGMIFDLIDYGVLTEDGSLKPSHKIRTKFLNNFIKAI